MWLFEDLSEYWVGETLSRVEESYTEAKGEGDPPYYVLAVIDLLKELGVWEVVLFLHMDSV